MAAQRRSLAALEKLKQQHYQVLRNYHNPKIKAVTEQINDEQREQASRIMKEIEDYCIKKYPQLTRFLKCENGHSKAHVNSMEIGLNFNGKADPAKLKKLEELQKQADQDMRYLELWYTRFLSNCASGDEVPDFRFELKHLEGTSAEYKHYYDGYV